ncbi:hypothetical protein [Pseudokineococcus sp. 1T1Z-3]|uniref:hypothetical protein n=1 Tax=Pseudokineococcus sp. 1T1Z-3 TaxID=3132745 RepID=UPI0030A806E8
MSADLDLPVDADRLTAAAAAAVGEHADVALRERLRSSPRTVVVRADLTDAGGTRPVVLKLSVDAGETGAREEAALRLLASRGATGVVGLLGVGEDLPVLVLQDLGEHPTLADHLLGRDADAATSALTAWASAVGRLQAATRDDADAFAAALERASPLGPPALDTTAEDLRTAVSALGEQLPALGVDVPGAVAEELRGLGDQLGRSEAPRGLVTGDTCPDNAVLVPPGPGAPDGVRLLDLEGAQHRHVAWEAAYLLLPWPSCWCSWRLPPDATATALAAWRDAVAPTVPASCSPADLDADLDAAVVAWTVVTASWFLPAALGDDPGPSDPRLDGLVPRRRALLPHRLGVAARAADGRWPVLASWCEQVREVAVRAWGERPLELAPAYR